MYTHWKLAVLCTKEFSAPTYIAFEGTYDISNDIIDDVTVIK